MKAEDFLTIEEIAGLLRVQVSAVRARLSRDDTSLPPSVRVGGRRLFPKSLYIEWRDSLLAAHAAKPALDVQSTLQSANRARCGRPESLLNCSPHQVVPDPLEASTAERPSQPVERKREA
ncbi:MAG: hypothetical protein KBC73_16990 [Burkholderiaceae bacterium]|nr:hypothetical protein [Burkholderiaceae bacterium]